MMAQPAPAISKPHPPTAPVNGGTNAAFHSPSSPDVFKKIPHRSHVVPTTLPVASPLNESMSKLKTSAASGSSTIVISSPPQNQSTPSNNSSVAVVDFSHSLQISTDSSHTIHVSSNSSSAYPLLTSGGDPQSPSSLQTSSSYRSPTKWTNFEEDSDVDDSDENGADSPATPGAFARMDHNRNTRSDSHQSEAHSEEGGAFGRASLTERTVSSDTETKNLLEPDAMSESDAQSLFEGSEDPYVMSEEQRSYYRDYFKQLLKQTQGTTDTSSGAIRGADRAVQEFFHKSKLDRDALRKIWELADVNKDGWLNLDEFSVCMHLIVLHVKGNLLIPDFLPPHIAPPPTPIRGEDGAKGGAWHNFEEDSGETTSSNASRTSRTGPLVSPSPKNREFTSNPPVSGMEKPVAMKASPEAEMVLAVTDSVDGGAVILHQYPATVGRRRTHTADSIERHVAAAMEADVYNVPSSPSSVSAAAQKKAATLPMSPPGAPAAPLVPKGPPPKPPPRPARGHVRSASLDLAKTDLPLASAKAAPPPVASRVKVHRPSSRERAPPPSIPPEDALPPLPSSPNTADAETQTHSKEQPDVGLSRNRHSAIPPMLDMDDDAGEEMSGDEARKASDLGGMISAEEEKGASGTADYKARVKRLRKINGELERERAKLCEMRLQLELRLQRLKTQKK